MNFFLQKLSIWWGKDPMRGKICVALTTLHLLALVSLFFTPVRKVENKKQKIVVRTIKPSPSSYFVAHTQTEKKQSVSKATPANPPSPPTPIKTPTPVKKNPPPVKAAPKAPAKKPPEKKAPASKEPTASKEKKPPTSKSIPPSSNNLQKSLKEIEETIAKIAANNDKIAIKRAKETSSKLNLPPQDLALPFSTEEDYTASLVGCLQEHLRLPDSGEVKIELVLRKDGRIESIKVLSAQSEKNKLHLEEEIPRLQFPPFPQEEGWKKSKVFILTFCNDF